MSNIITIDGPASSGKSTVGFLFAQQIEYQFIDSGLIYRLDALLVTKENVSVDDEQGCADVLKNRRIEFVTVDDKVKVLLDTEDVTVLLKTPAVDKIVPLVAVHRKVREEAKKIQREVGCQQNSVVAGRDIGSEVFPDSPLKFFITASVEARAKRRYDQQIQNHPEIKLKDIEEDIRNRDEKDANRTVSPMRVPANAIVIDSSDKTIQQVLDILLEYFHKYF